MIYGEGRGGEGSLTCQRSGLEGEPVVGARGVMAFHGFSRIMYFNLILLLKDQKSGIFMFFVVVGPP